MQITDIRIRKLNDDGRMKAIVSVTLDDSLAIHDIKVIDSEDKLFVAMPSRKTAEGGFMDVAHPINPQARQKLHDAIIEKYHDACVKAQTENV